MILETKQVNKNGCNDSYDQMPINQFKVRQKREKK